jgi:spermidine dehydrogenase
VGIDEIAAADVVTYNGMPGLEHMLPVADGDPYIFHFPDGNAGVARLLVRSLVPGALPGNSMEDSVTARLDYSTLDRPGQDTRIRLNSTVVEARHSADQENVLVTYVQGGQVHTVSARHSVMACYNMAIPYLCPELPAAQKAGLAHGVKSPMAYVKVGIPNWRAFADLGLDYVYYTNDFYKQVELDFPISLGGQQRSATPDEPMILHMCHVPYFQNISGPEQWRQGRRQLLETPFATFEERVRAQLDEALGGAGFDAGRDITAITVNRWPHGYAYEPGLGWEPEYASESDKPWVIGRQPYGRIHIANSDAAPSAMTQAAIDQAWRAIDEIEIMGSESSARVRIDSGT